MGHQIDIKGNRDGLIIRVTDHPDFAVYENLRRELEKKRDFLQGSRIALEIGRRTLNNEQLTGLRELFDTHKLLLWAIIADDRETREKAREMGLATRLSGSATDLEGNALKISPNGKDNGTNGTKEAPPANALLLRETLRSGRSVVHEGHVVILGDVNPGAEVIATGNVIVWGRLRGMVHAGAAGEASAVICALELNPTQLRIADRIAVAPDDNRADAVPEQATIRDGQIVAENWKH
ncbi:MAG: septum site-determining protein MinC [Candidatus Promineofilum sp.]|nr:septum site-determining protein MinC [Promineifilum sp.]MBP9657780.1 septum site-determining protein MinC [Promineifilum sp.]